MPLNMQEKNDREALKALCVLLFSQDETITTIEYQKKESDQRERKKLPFVIGLSMIDRSNKYT